jgi:hypothetical protein
MWSEESSHFLISANNITEGFRCFETTGLCNMENASVGYRLLNALGFELFELHPVDRLPIIVEYFKTMCRAEEIEDSCKKPTWIARFSATILTGKSADEKPDCVIMHCAVCLATIPWPIRKRGIWRVRFSDSAFKY